VRTRPTILYFGPVDTPVPDLVRRWADDKSFPLVVLADRDEVESIILRGHPSLLFVDGERMGKEARTLVASLKADPFSAIVPVTVLEGAHDPVAMQEWFAAGADEILTAVFPPPEQRARLDAMLVRTQRDVAVHPSTRMPGTPRSSARSGATSNRARNLQSVTPTSITSRNSTTGIRTTMATGSSTCCRESSMTW